MSPRRFSPLARALLSARAAPLEPRGQPLYESYLWELDYLAARFEGIFSLYRAHLAAETDPRLAGELNGRAQAAFAEVRELFRERKEYRMSALRELEPEVPYTAGFLKDWETRGFWEPRSLSFHVVWERLGEFEKILGHLKPEAGP